MLVSEAIIRPRSQRATRKLSTPTTIRERRQGRASPGRVAAMDAHQFGPRARRCRRLHRVSPEWTHDDRRHWLP